ncbi:MAG: hypothetical protein SF162_17145 [bacterium]|nr:hypothetical protein [bacterium]
MAVEIFSFLMIGALPALLLLFILAAVPSMLLLGFIGASFMRQAKAQSAALVAQPIRSTAHPTR